MFKNKLSSGSDWRVGRLVAALNCLSFSLSLFLSLSLIQPPTKNVIIILLFSIYCGRCGRIAWIDIALLDLIKGINKNHFRERVNTRLLSAEEPNYKRSIYISFCITFIGQHST